MQLILFAMIGVSQAATVDVSTQPASPDELEHHEPIDDTPESHGGAVSVNPAHTLSLRRTSSVSAGDTAPAAVSVGAAAAPVAAHDDFCVGDNPDWAIDYYILREGYDFSKDFKLKLNWICSIDVDEMSARFSEERSQIIRSLRSIEDSVDDLVNSVDDVEALLDDENVQKISGGLIERHEVLESLTQAMDILWSTKSSQNETEISLRQSMAMYIAMNAQEFEDTFGWTGEFCYDDKLPLSLFASSRFSGADFGSAMEFFKILDALKFSVPSTAPIVDELTEYVHSRRIKIKTCWEAVDALNILFQTATDFTFFRSPSSELISSIQKSLKYLVDYEEAIFM